MYRLIYPTDEVSLADIAKAALAQCGTEGVSVVSGAGSQAVRVPESCADRVETFAGVAPAVPQEPDDGSAGDSQEPAGDGQVPDPQDPPTAPGPDETEPPSPDPDASTEPAPADNTTPGRPAGRAADRPARQRGARRSKEG